MVLAKLDQAAVRVEYRIRIGKILLHINGCVVRIHVQPRRACREARLRLIIPLHRRARIVSAFGINRSQDIVSSISLGQAIMIHVDRFDVLHFINA